MKDKLSGEELLGWVDDMLVDHCRSPREIELADAIRTMIKQNERDQDTESSTCYDCGKEIEGEKVCKVRAFHPECSYKWVADKPGQGGVPIEPEDEVVGRLWRNPDRMGGAWCVFGTRILADSVVMDLKQAQPHSKISVGRDDVDKLWGEIRNGWLLFGGLIDWLTEIGVEVKGEEE